MSNGRNPKRRGHDSSRDAGGFVALPWAVLDSPAYLGLSHPAKALLLEVARQFVRDNNGQLLCSRAYMAGRGWYSHDVLQRAKRELIAAGLLFETVMGQRPNKAAWYALTWRALDRHPGYDVGAVANFKRGAYRASENAPLSPSGGTGARDIGPGDGTGASATVPRGGPIRGLFGPLPVPGDGHHLDNHLLHRSRVA
ncbi:hypothetical protein [Pseudorhodoferax sp. Leaf274]|uniref:hypothetical protein n=1 Tax=Pseudorhodoferax sp. Leaf274 TaxID=1736318 RepID=UPI000702C214|nr:hypothetical protein [Pseudorhodoferax sp. Leaf274]KQP43518.1 hypothetical protein ASF44_29770 [Pseudorhodoferax sp. Leaf274]